MRKYLKDNILIVQNVENWRDGVNKSGEILLNKDYINRNYIDATIKNIEKLGNYIILTDDVAMPHARPEDGVKKTGISLLIIKKGVNFLGENVNLIFTLASKDNSSHIEIIRELSMIIDNENLIKKLIVSKSEQEALNLL